MNKIGKYIAILGIATSMASCNDFFEMERPPQLPINSLEDLEMAAVSPYSNLFNGGWGTFHSCYLLNEVLQSDLFAWIGNVEDYPTEELFERRYNQRITQVTDLYNSLYTTIGLCNSGLYFYQTTGDNPLPYESEEDYELNVKRIKGELLFTRAFAYYHLAEIFCPPYGYGHDEEAILVKRDRMVESAEDAMNNMPSPTSEIYSMIISDLIEAIELLPEQWANGMHDSYQSRGRANRWAAKVLLAQVYFTMQNFEEALDIYDDIIANSGYSLEENPFTNFANESTRPLLSENKEVIMWKFCADDIKHDSNMRHDAGLRLCQFNKNGVKAEMGGNGPDAMARVPNWSMHDWLQVNLSKSALVKMGWMNEDGSETQAALNDLRYYNQPSDAGAYVNKEGLFYRFEGADPDLMAGSKRTGASADGKYITYNKYATFIQKNDPLVLVNKYFRSNTGRYQNLPLYRMAEVYLNRAAARLKLGIGGWSDDYNKVASRAWNNASTPFTPKNDAQVSLEDIRIERWKELAGEDDWYMRFCAALGLPVANGERKSAGAYSELNSSNFGNAYWKECIPLAGELDFRQ